jgi:hypothetical protein
LIKKEKISEVAFVRLFLDKDGPISQNLYMAAGDEKLLSSQVAILGSTLPGV